MTDKAEELNTDEQTLQDEAAFAAGFQDAHGDEPPAPEPDKDELKQEADQQTDETDDPDEPMFAGFKESEIKTLLAKAARLDDLEGKVFGKFGEVQRTIQQLQKGEGGQRVAFTADRLKRLQEFDPEFAEALAADLSEVWAPTAEGQPAQAQPDPEEVKRLFEARVASATDELSQKFEAKLLALKHPDWRQVNASEDFSVWKSTLDEATRNQLADTWDASYIAEKIDTFKVWKDKRSQKQARQETNQRRLQRATAPNGTSGLDTGNPDDEEAAFAAGFKGMRGT